MKKLSQILLPLSLAIIVLSYAIFLYLFINDIKLLIVQLSENIKVDGNFLLFIFAIIHSLIFTYVYFKMLWFFTKNKS